MARSNRIGNTLARAFLFTLLLSVSHIHGWAEPKDKKPAPAGEQKQAQTDQKPSQPAGQKQAQPAAQKQTQQNDQKQMRGLDEQIQEVKSDVLRISAELSQLEEKLLYPSGTQVAVFVSLAKDDSLRLDAVRLKVDGQLAAHYIYSAKELEAMRKGGVQRLYVGNVATGEHQIEVLVEGKLENGADFSRSDSFAFRKEVKPKLMGLTLAGSGNPPITLGEW
jgi:invasion protein IalB